ncbi:hypothetical protein EZS27_043710, partial [termite gut metagenome]
HKVFHVTKSLLINYQECVVILIKETLRSYIFLAMNTIFCGLFRMDRVPYYWWNKKQHRNIQKYMLPLQPILIVKEVLMKNFEELGVSPEILKAIEELGFVNPMPVQEEVIPYLLGENNDIVALAQTGTGKTAAFGLPIIQKIDVENRVPQSLVLCPTRELCLQIAGDLNDYCKYVDGLKV